MDAHSQLIGCQALFRLSTAGTDLRALAGRLLEQAGRNIHAAHSLMDLSWIFLMTGQEDQAASAQALALSLQQLYHLPAASGTVGLRLLALLAPGDYLANTPLECLLEGSDVALDLLFLGPDLPFPDPLPPHDLLFIAVREAEANLPLLKRIEERLARSPEPVVNRPGRIPLLARDQASELLGSIPGVLMPPTARVDRRGLLQWASGTVAFPLIVRPVGSHRGRDLVKLDDLAAVQAHLATASTPEFYVSRFVDYHSPDGQFRKYRIVLMDGQAHAAHLAISGHWLVNYINSHMEESADKRAEEAAFMTQFETGFGGRHAAAFQAIQARLQLDYLVVDCAETGDGRLLLFEVDSAAMVHANDPVEVFPYKQPQMRTVFAAFRRLLGRVAGSH